MAALHIGSVSSPKANAPLFIVVQRLHLTSSDFGLSFNLPSLPVRPRPPNSVIGESEGDYSMEHLSDTTELHISTRRPSLFEGSTASPLQPMSPLQTSTMFPASSSAQDLNYDVTSLLGLHPPMALPLTPTVRRW